MNKKEQQMIAKLARERIKDAVQPTLNDWLRTTIEHAKRVNSASGLCVLRATTVSYLKDKIRFGCNASMWYINTLNLRDETKKLIKKNMCEEVVKLCKETIAELDKCISTKLRGRAVEKSVMRPTSRKRYNPATGERIRDVV